ncbi:hypothetical protein AB0876_28920 [Mycobacterium sp. NPDC049093]
MVGSIIYGGAEIYEGPNSQLVYIDAITRRVFELGLGFALVFTVDNERSARSIWMSPNVPLEFRYDDYETIEISGEGVKAIAAEVIRKRKFVLCSPAVQPFRIINDRGAREDELLELHRAAERERDREAAGTA